MCTSSFTSVSIIWTAYFSTNNGIADVESDATEWPVHKLFQELIDADSQAYCIARHPSSDVFIEKLNVWLQKIAPFFTQCESHFKSIEKWVCLLCQPVWDTSWAELAGQLWTEPYLAELIAPRHCYGRRWWSTHAKASFDALHKLACEPWSLKSGRAVH